MDPTRRRLLLSIAFLALARPGEAASPVGSPWVFPAIDGGTIDLAAFRGGPVLVVNTASRCGATPQYDALQTLFDRYRARGLTVVAVPSQSFGQELGSDAEVKAFCAMTFDLDLPMTGLVAVTGPGAHPFYRWAQAQGVVPTWNFHKILLDARGRIVGQWDRDTDPLAPELVAAIEAALAGG